MSEHPHELLSADVARATAYDRQGGYCLRCHEPMPLDRFEAHHRRRRQLLGWCACNVVALHARCHTQGAYAVHDHPQTARDLGLIVPSWGVEPCEIPVLVKWPFVGMALLSCDGMVCSVDSRDLVT